MEIALLTIGIINLLFLIAIAAAVSKLIRYVTERDSEPVMASRTQNTDRGLQELQDEKDDRWGLHMSYDLPNYDGVSPRPKNFDGVGDSILTEADTEGRIE